MSIRILPCAALALAAGVPASLSAQNERIPSCDAPVAAANKARAVVPVYVYNNHVYVRVCAGGRELDFVFDTGAGATVIDLNLAKKIGLTLGESFRVGGIGAGTSAARRVDDGMLGIAGAGLKQPVLYALDLYPLSRAMGHVLDGILGYDFISRNIIALDYARHEMHLYDRAAFRYRGSGATLPIALISGKPYVDAELRLADGGAVRGRFLIDVGSNSGLSLAKPFVDEHRLRQRVGSVVHPPGTGGVGGFTTMVVGRAAGLRLGGIDVPNPEVELFGDSAGVLSRGPYAGIIGGDVLQRFTVIFDYQSKTMILEPNDLQKTP